VHFVKQRGDLLNLIQHGPASRRQVSDEGFDPMRVTAQFKVERGIEQVKPHCFWKDLLEPRALACTPWSKEKKRSVRPMEEPGDKVWLMIHGLILHQLCKIATQFYNMNVSLKLVDMVPTPH
jgi:hypothetical protein